MLKVKQFRYHSDNLGYIVHGARDALAIDGGDPDAIFSYLRKTGLKLLLVTNTHDHPDHTTGNAALMKSPGAVLLTYSELLREKGISLEGEKIDLYITPGHTEDSVCFHAGNVLISGDTLFNGTIGNCFTGDLRKFYESIRKIMHLPGETIVYAGHDYVRDSMEFARKLEPENRSIGSFMRRYRHDHVFSTMEDERRINPYLRFNETGIINVLERLGLTRKTEWERWHSLMTIE